MLEVIVLSPFLPSPLETSSNFSCPAVTVTVANRISEGARTNDDAAIPRPAMGDLPVHVTSAAVGGPETRQFTVACLGKGEAGSASLSEELEQCTAVCRSEKRAILIGVCLGVHQCTWAFG